MKYLALVLMFLIATPVHAAISVVGSTMSTNALTLSGTCLKPEGTQQGDLMLAFINPNGSQTVTDDNGSTPFTQDYVSTDYASAVFQIWSRYMGAAEPASYTFQYGGADRATLHCMTFRGVDQTTKYDVAPGLATENITGTTAAPTTTPITTVANGAMVIALVASDTTNLVFASSTPRLPYFPLRVQSIDQPIQSSYQIKQTAGLEPAVEWTFTVTAQPNLTQTFSLNPAAETKTQTIILEAGQGMGNQTWTVPLDYDAATSKIECIGSGGYSTNSAAGVNSAASGGGGAYAAIYGLALTPGASVTYNLGASATTSAGGNWNETYFNSTASSSAPLSCAFGKKATAFNGSNSFGGTVLNSTGHVRFPGGAGANGSNSGGGSGAGGGGAGGPRGPGKAGAVGAGTRAGGGGGGSGGGASSPANAVLSAAIGGNGGNGSPGNGLGAGSVDNGVDGFNGGGGGGAQGNYAGGNGGCDQAFDSTHGSCGGGAGGEAGPGGIGGRYGGGGGGAGRNATNIASTTGGHGIISITYGVPRANFTLPSLGKGLMNIMQGTFIIK